MSDSMYVKSDEDFTMHYGENQSYFVLADEYHNYYELIYIVSGKIQITINNKTYVADSNTLVVINNMEPHNFSVLEYPYCRYVVMFKQNFLGLLVNEPVLASIFNYRPRNFNHLIKLAPEQVPMVNDLFTRMQTEYAEMATYWEKSIKMLIGQFAVHLYRISDKSFPLSNYNNTINKKIIIEIQNYIDEHYMEDISLTDIADKFHTNMYYLCHLFKEITGNTFKAYLISRRVSFAKDLLSYTNKDITEIATETGFSSGIHFIRTFKKAVCVTPHQYRKNYHRSLDLRV